MSCIISQWYGRTGNNILQIAKALYFCYTKNMNNVKFPSHPLLYSQTIILRNDISQILPDVRGMFYDQDNKIELNIEKMRELSIRYILPILKIKPVISDLKVAHIRGGDIFNSNPHRLYIQPPLSYYDNLKPDLIIHEDFKNPCVNKLKEKGYTLQSNNLHHDLAILLGSKEIICSNSTFCFISFLLNEHLDIIHVPQELVTHMKNAINVVLSSEKIKKHEFPGYIPYGTWVNNPEQFSKMITYVVQI